MLFKSLASLFKDVVTENNSYKYKVTRIEYGKHPDDVNVYCEEALQDEVVIFCLKDIFQENKLQYFSASDVLLLSREFNSTKVDKIISYYDTKKYYNLIGLVFTLCLVVSNLAAIRIWSLKLGSFGEWHFAGGIFIFPLLYVLNDVVTEVYGFLASRKIIWTALFANCVFSLFLYGVTFLPAVHGVPGQEEFTGIFRQSPVIVVASVTSYFIGELINATIISWLKIRFKGQLFVFRALFSTLMGAFTESAIFCVVAFTGRMPNEVLVNMIFSLTTIKVIYEIVVMPITVRLVAFLKNSEKMNVFEKPSLKGLIPGFVR